MSKAVAASAEGNTIQSLKTRRAAEIDAIMRRYPVRRSGVMSVLYLFQEEFGWISPEVMEEVAAICSMTPAEVKEMVTFYTMYHEAPVGKNVLWVCGTLPCALCGADGLFDYLKERLGVGLDEVTPDGLFTIKRAECLGACSEAPLMLVNDRMEIKLTRKKVDAILEACGMGRGVVKPAAAKEEKKSEAGPEAKKPEARKEEAKQEAPKKSAKSEPVKKGKGEETKAKKKGH